MSPLTSGRMWKQKQSKRSHLEEHFWLLLKSHNIQQNFVREFHPDPTRRWRVDFCDQANRIIVEIEGAVYTQGRHTRGSGFVKDVEKYNALTIQGWRLLRYTSIETMRDFFDHYQQILASRKTMVARDYGTIRRHESYPSK